MQETKLIRPDWDFRELHRERWSKIITAVICERDTYDITRLCIESFLRFYPDVPIVIVDGGSIDSSINYVNYKALTPNIQVWHREGRNGHGTMLDEAIKKYVKTDYVLLLDSDVIVKRGNWIEPMILLLEENPKNYATGTLMYVTFSNDGCGLPKDDLDILPYAHPSCSIIKRRLYANMMPFVEHGAPLVYNMKQAMKNGFEILYFPIENYVAHLSGASWVEPNKPTWKDDMNVISRPFVTFVRHLDSDDSFLISQKDKDFDIVLAGNYSQASVFVYTIGAVKPNNPCYPLRFRVQGEYICELKSEVTGHYPGELISEAKKECIEQAKPAEFTVYDLKFVKREIWQSRECLS